MKFGRRKPRNVLVGALAVVLALLLAACPADEVDEPAPPDDVDAEDTDPEALDLTGVELTLLIHPTLYDAAGGDGGLVSEFEEMTGAQVEVVTAGIGDHMERAMVEFAAGTGAFDVINMQNHDLHEEVVPHLLDLTDFIAGTGPDYDYDDFPDSLVEGATTLDDRVVGIPYRFAPNTMYYRADLFEEAGVSPPETFEEVFEVAEALREVAPDVTPWVQRGLDEEITHDWLGFLYGHGGQVLSDDFETCVVNSEEGVAAAQFYRDLVEADIVPEDIFAISRDDYIARMQRGEVAAGVYFGPYYGRLIDPAESDYPEDIGAAFQPTAPGVEPGRTRAAGWYLTIAQDSQNAEAAFALIQYITNPENATRSALEWANAPVRLSTYNDPQYLDRFPVADLWADSIAASAVDPPVPGITEVVDIISEELVGIVRGDQSPQEGMDNACSRIDDVLG